MTPFQTGAEFNALKLDVSDIFNCAHSVLNKRYTILYRVVTLTLPLILNHILLYLTLSYSTLSYPILPCPILFYPIPSHAILFYLALPYSILPSHEKKICKKMRFNAFLVLVRMLSLDFKRTF